jgi:hypothetical protein
MNQQTRTVTDNANCNVTAGKPDTTKSCSTCQASDWMQSSPQCPTGSHGNVNVYWYKDPTKNPNCVGGYTPSPLTVQVACNANDTPATCGSAAGQASSTVPNANLCGPGSSANFNTGNGTSNYWSWTCSGPGLKDTSCTAPKPSVSCLSPVINSTTSLPAGVSYCSIPQLVSATYSSADTTWHWICTDPNNSNPETNHISCSDKVTLAPPTCGSPTISSVDPTTNPPAGNFCGSDDHRGPSLTYQSDQLWHWVCYNSNESSNVPCTLAVTVTPATCGDAVNHPINTTPSQNLCAARTPTAFASPVQDKGDHWSWTCANNSAVGAYSVPCQVAKVVPTLVASKERNDQGFIGNVSGNIGGHTGSVTIYWGQSNLGHVFVGWLNSVTLTADIAGNYSKNNIGYLAQDPSYQHPYYFEAVSNGVWMDATVETGPFSD